MKEEHIVTFFEAVIYVETELHGATVGMHLREWVCDIRSSRLPWQTALVSRPQISLVLTYTFR